MTTKDAVVTAFGKHVNFFKGLVYPVAFVFFQNLHKPEKDSTGTTIKDRYFAKYQYQFLTPVMFTKLEGLVTVSHI